MARLRTLWRTVSDRRSAIVLARWAGLRIVIVTSDGGIGSAHERLKGILEGVLVRPVVVLPARFGQIEGHILEAVMMVSAVTGTFNQRPEPLNAVRVGQVAPRRPVCD